MVSVQTVYIISFICAVLNGLFTFSSLMKFGRESVPYGKVYDLLSSAVSATSLGADIMMMKAINFGNVQDAYITKSFSKLMGMALSAKLFVITFDFFAPTVYFYNAAQNYLRSLQVEGGTWTDYLKGNPPLDNVEFGQIYFGTSFLGVTLVTVVKGIVLFFLHDYYEGVKQLGKLTSNGLQDDVSPEAEGAPGQSVQVMPGYYVPGGVGGGAIVPQPPPGFVFISPYPGYPVAQPYPVSQPYPTAQPLPSGANYPRAMHFVPHPP